MTDRIHAIHGDSREVLKTLADASVDSCVCDPPYSLVSIVKRFGANGAAPAKGNEAYMRASAGFMGQKWDTGETAHDPDFWREVYRVLKPGAHVVAFGGTRTFHRLVCAIEDAGFEVRDLISWIFGSGFPKSHNAGNGWGTALKPALEPITLARKPLVGTVAANVQQYGTGAINIDGCRVATDETVTTHTRGTNGAFPKRPTERSAEESGRHTDQRTKLDTLTERAGRWPANVIHDGSEEVVGAFPETESGAFQRGDTARAEVGHNGIYGRFNGAPDGKDFGPANAGSAARFFYTAKADSDDRIGSKHPTVKPIDLMQYLIRLVTPKVVYSCPRCQVWGDDDGPVGKHSCAICGHQLVGRAGLVLDPFAGTGTTGEAAFREGMRALLIEREPQYFADIQRRLKLMTCGPDERQRESIKASGKTQDAGPLFA